MALLLDSATLDTLSPDILYLISKELITLSDKLSIRKINRCLHYLNPIFDIKKIHLYKKFKGCIENKNVFTCVNNECANVKEFKHIMQSSLLESSYTTNRRLYSASQKAMSLGQTSFYYPKVITRHIPYCMECTIEHVNLGISDDDYYNNTPTVIDNPDDIDNQDQLFCFECSLSYNIDNITRCSRCMLTICLDCCTHNINGEIYCPTCM